MKIDWTKVKEGFTLTDVLKEENKELKEEIERLNNIINELEKGLRSLYDFDKGVISKDYLDCVDDTLEKLQELKGEDKE